MIEEIASVAYWYQKEPHEVFPSITADKDRILRPEIRVVDIHRKRAA